jgi:hypothetical protein
MAKKLLNIGILTSFFLLETRLQDGRDTKILSNWGFTGTIEVAHIGLSGGLALGWHSEF